MMQQQKLATSYATILGQMIRNLRDNSNLDQSKLAKALDVSVMTISRIESGDTVLEVPQMEKVATFFGMEPLEFFKKSLEIKKATEQEHVVVLPSKKELNKKPDLAIISVAALVGIIGGIFLISRR
jgi:transcriptional regulator with XRE-family HTH domain